MCLNKDSDLSWAAFNASQQDEVIKPNMIQALLPLFSEKSSSVAMIKHSMDIIQTTTEHLNPGQTPVIVMGLPLNAIGNSGTLNNTMRIVML